MIDRRLVMSWKSALIESLRRQPIGGYLPDSEPASEPVALASLALLAADQLAAALRAANWLIERQQADGSVGVSAAESTPMWPTSLAIIVWSALDLHTASNMFAAAVGSGLRRILAVEGKTSPRSDDVGHDTTLVGWPWVSGTHSWLEPTALAVLALKHAGHGKHPRTREAVQVLIDRQFASGGCNYGNTSVLGQELMPHVQPTATVLLAVVDERPSARIAASVTWLAAQWPTLSGLASRCLAAMALAAHQQLPADVDTALQREYQRAVRREISTYQQALLLLAAQHRGGLLPAELAEGLPA
jgi:hypothetical protein